MKRMQSPFFIFYELIRRQSRSSLMETVAVTGDIEFSNHLLSKLNWSKSKKTKTYKHSMSLRMPKRSVKPSSKGDVSSVLICDTVVMFSK